MKIFTKSILVLSIFLLISSLLAQQQNYQKPPREDVYVEYEYDPRFPVVDSVAASIIGAIGFALSLSIVWHFEMKSANRAAFLEAVGQNVVSLEVGRKGDNRVVHLTGNLTTFDYVTDEIYGVSLNALKLRRIVEVYQWTESTHSVRVGDVKRTEYRYKEVWREGIENSAGFRHPIDHQNPQINHEEFATSRSFSPKHGIIDDLFVSQAILEKIPTQPLLLNHYVIEGVRYPYFSSISYQERDNCLYVGYDYNNPAIGDLRIRFEYADNGIHSIIAERDIDHLVPHIVNGESIDMILAGSHNAYSMINMEKQSNNSCMWISRVICLLVNMISSIMIISPILTILNFIPLFGPLISSSGILAVIILSFVWVGLTIFLSAIFRNNMIFLIIGFSVLLMILGM